MVLSLDGLKSGQTKVGDITTVNDGKGDYQKSINNARMCACVLAFRFT